jgi:tRNA (cytidine/uridine-2'-O-)-methyltransferase
MLHVVLFRPEIPPNTGNVIRLCANTGARLHLIAPLGFDLDHAKLRRAGLDYREFAEVRVHESLDAFAQAIAPARLFALDTRGTRRFDAVDYRADDALLFGPESAGLPPDVLSRFPADHVLRLPMRPGNRSLNLSNAVAVTVFEAWRQHGWQGSA